MAIIAESYQRFESQRIVGRNYPWHPDELCQERKEMLQRRTTAVAPGSLKPPQSMVTTSTMTPTVMEIPDVMRGFNESQPDTLRAGALGTPPTSPSSPQHPRRPFDQKDVNVDTNARKTLHVDDNFFDGRAEFVRPKSSSDSIIGEPSSGIYDIEIDGGHTEPISDQESGKKKTLGADVDKIKLLQEPSLYGNEPRVIKVDPPPTTDLMKQQQLNGDQHDQQEQRRRRPSYLAQGDMDLFGHHHQTEGNEEEGDDADDNDGHDYYNFDTSPTSPPPALPLMGLSPFNKILNYPLNRLSTITDMFLLDTELYVKDHVPRLPEKIARHEFKSHHSTMTTSTVVAKAQADTNGHLNSILIAGYEDDAVKNSIAINVHWTGEDLATQRDHDQRPSAVDYDVVDGNVLMMPRRRRMVVGLEQEDFFAKTVGFLAWFFFLLMRVLSISVFAYLHWREAIYICLGHYLIMLGCLISEVKLHGKMQRMVFYVFLSYVYVFVILEFKIKFIHLRMWYGLYVGFVLTQNFVLSVWWYVAVMDLELWWFDYLFRTILGSGVLSLCCLLVYYLRLKPKDKVLFELMEESDQDRQ